MSALFRRKQYCIAVLVLIFCSHSPVWAEEITLVADIWCPYNCEPNEKKPGYLVELATKIFSEHGISVHYEVLPWQRAITFVREGKYNGLIGSGLSETPDFIFPDEGLAAIKHVFLTSSESNWTFSGLSSLHGIKLGAIKGYSYGQLLESYIEPNANNKNRLTILHGDDELGRLIDLLAQGKIDALIEERATILHFLNHQTDAPNLREAGIGDEEDIFIAFSPNLAESKRYADILSQGLKEMRNSGELDLLLKEYNLQ